MTLATFFFHIDSKIAHYKFRKNFFHPLGLHNNQNQFHLFNSRIVASLSICHLFSSPGSNDTLIISNIHASLKILNKA
ncbi:hypothetical protein EB796_013985 [Bugula neritina]|uniref:Uncharacterized protein n=1 Tax=Bugula neritina TaxID=10212 RepID=A0A7J7JNX9_BUGNE|nr:hypothetical protein EB796_013985 [Bugula neritina]